MKPRLSHMAFLGGNALERFLAFMHTMLPAATDTAGRTPCPQQSCVHLQCPFRLRCIETRLSPVAVLQFGFRLQIGELFPNLEKDFNSLKVLKTVKFTQLQFP